LEWYAFLLFQQPGIFSPVLSAKALTQEVITDFWAYVERGRMNFIRLNQEKLKSKAYNMLVASLENQGEPTGKKVILPSTFIGGPRAMVQLYQDLMAICCKYGTPLLFITMTANPKWFEIGEAIPEGTKTYDNPVKVSRVYCLKSKELVHQINKMKRFGKVIAYVSTIEFQKRGLPHLHLMVTLDPLEQPVTPEEIDLIVTAKIPDPITSPVLHVLVGNLMTHGLCQGGPCWQSGCCNKGYPRPFAKRKVNIDGAYPFYKRRNTGVTVTKNGTTFDNRWVVPYNKFLMLMFECHINVEIPVNTTAIKYLYKYITKGHDRTFLNIKGNNEINMYIKARYISAPEGKLTLN
jgi:hypothetical protein